MQPRKLIPFDTTTLNVREVSTPLGCASGLAVFFENNKGKSIGHDVETTLHEDFFNRKMRTCQFGNQKEQYVTDLLSLCDGDADLLAKAQGYYGKNLHLAPKLQVFVQDVRKVLESGDWTKVGVNLGFEYMTWYWNFGIRMWKIWDCSQVERVIYAGAHSLKDYDFFSMASMAERYLGYEIDKTLQTSFTIDQPLSNEQHLYACLDTRLPMSYKAIQNLVLSGRTAKNNTNPANAQFLAYIDPIVTGDDLLKAAEIENECIGFFTEFHVHGERIDTDRWLKRVAEKKLLLAKNIEELDEIFLPIVGSKLDVITDEMIAQARANWKVYAELGPDEKQLLKVTQEELDLAKKIRKANKDEDHNLAADGALELNKVRMSRLTCMQELANERIVTKEALKKVASELGKKRTRLKKLAAQCEGKALIHYKSNAQLLKELQKMKGLGKLKNLDDDTLQKHKNKYRVMDLILTYHKLSKEIGTYGDSWAKVWVTHPCKDEGWLNPGDKRLHCTFNPFDAETGRSSSSQPNAQNLPQDPEVRQCFIADPPDELEPEGYRLLTCDMSGAELRIIAELAGDPIWIGAFERGEDVHSVGTELLQGLKWTAAIEEGCAYYAINPKTGNPAKQKCKCKDHKKLRDATKAINFLLCYGGGPNKLANELDISVNEAVALMELHEQMFPRIWAYLLQSGTSAKTTKKAFDIFGGRRLFPKPTREKAIEWCKDRKEEKLRLSEDVCEKNIAEYIVKYGKKPSGDILYDITHRKPTEKEINSGMGALAGSIERQGKNHAIQGSNARIAKKSFGSGHDLNGKPYLWHILPKFNARYIKFIHDEIVISVPKRNAKDLAYEVQDCIKRAAAEVMHSVVMESDFNIESYWCK